MPKRRRPNDPETSLRYARWAVDGGLFLSQLKTTSDFNPEMAYAFIDAAAKITSEINDRA